MPIFRVTQRYQKSFVIRHVLVHIENVSSKKYHKHRKQALLMPSVLGTPVAVNDCSAQ
jgi:hypothetical protein